MIAVWSVTVREKMPGVPIIPIVPLIPAAACAALMVLLAGCDFREAQEEVRSVDWYESHPAERTAKLSECMTSEGPLDATPDCINASRAENNAKGYTRWGTPKDEVRTEPAISG